MNRLMAAVSTLCVLGALGVAWLAAAQQPGQRMERGAPGRERVPAREAIWPQRQGQSLAPGQAQQGQDDHGPGGRMSPEERRQLRRDISAHGHDIYRERQGQ